MNALITDYFAAEKAIVDRLTAQVPGIVKIYTPFDLQGVIEASQASPALHVVYSGDVVGGTGPGQQAGAGASKIVDQRWLVVLAVRTAAAQLQDTTDIRTKAGALIPSVLGALQGWAPVQWMRPLARISGPTAGYSSSFAYFPFLFEGRVTT